MIVYKFGLLAPTENADLVYGQMQGAHQYRNTLTGIEHARRDAVRKLYSTVGDEGGLEVAFRNADEAVEAVLEEIKKARAKAFQSSGGKTKKGARVTPPDLADKLKVAREARYVAHGALIEYRRKLREDPSFVLGVNNINDLGNQLHKSAREHCNVYWGSYLLVEDEIQAAKKMPLYTPKGEPSGPRFESWPWWRREVVGRVIEGRVGVQIQEQSESRTELRVGDALRTKEEVSFFGHMLRKGALATVDGTHLGKVVVHCADGHQLSLTQEEVQESFRIVKAPFYCKQAYGSDPRLQIENIPDRENRPKYEGVWNILRMRIGSNGREPIFAAWPMKMSRPLPPDGVIKRVVVNLRHVGNREEWTVCFTVDHDGPATRANGYKPKPTKHGGEGVVAVNFGWRVIDDQLRVATWRSLDGQEGELRLSADWIEDLRFAESIRSRRDKEFDEARAWFAEWFKDNKHVVPAWLAKECESISAWKSAMRLAAVTKRWSREIPEARRLEVELKLTRRREDKKAELEGRYLKALAAASSSAPAAVVEEGVVTPDQAYERLETWRYHEHHLWTWECEQRERAIRRRKALYQDFAADLSRRFHTLVVEDFDISAVARRPGVADAGQNDNASSNRQLAAVGDLRLLLTQAYTARRGEKVEVSAVDNTRTCASCGVVEPFDAATSVVRDPPCSGCGAAWDQDTNNVRVQLRYYEALKQSPVVVKASAAAVDRWARAKQKKEEKEARIDAARKTAPAAGVDA